jgi:DNA polymerase-3 subunit epsilon
MFKTLQRWHNRNKLKQEKYAYLFAEPPDNEVICFDCETTNINPKKAETLSIGAVKINNQTQHRNRRSQYKNTSITPL